MVFIIVPFKVVGWLIPPNNISFVVEREVLKPTLRLDRFSPNYSQESDNTKIYFIILPKKSNVNKRSPH